MKKFFLMVTLLFVFFTFLGQGFAAPVFVSDTPMVWTEHRSFDQSGMFNGRSDIYNTTAYMAAQFSGASVTGVTIDFQGTPGIVYEDVPSGAWALSEGERSFATFFGSTNSSSGYNPSDWAGTYNFGIQTSDGDLSSSIFRADGELQVLSTPTITVTGNLVNWALVDGATDYMVRLLDMADIGNAIYQSDSISGTSLDLTGQVGAGAYVLRVDAIKTDNSGLLARGVYFSEITVTPTPIPGAVLLLGSGLLGLVGLKRKQRASCRNYDF